MILEDVTSPCWVLPPSPTWWPEEGDTGKSISKAHGTYPHSTHPQSQGKSPNHDKRRGPHPAPLPHKYLPICSSCLPEPGPWPGPQPWRRSQGCITTPSTAPPGTGCSGTAPAPPAPWCDSAVSASAGTAPANSFQSPLCLQIHEALTHEVE